MPPNGDSFDRAEKVALKLLSIRARSVHELSTRLVRHGFSESVVRRLLQHLAGFGYLNDLRFALDRATALMRDGQLGQRGIVDRLVRHGIAEGAAAQAVASAQAELGFTPLAAARSLLARRGFVGALDNAGRARAARWLLSRGFGEAEVESLLGSEALARGDAAD